MFRAIAVAALSAGPAIGGGLLDPSGRYAVQRWTVEDGLPDAPATGVAVAADGTLVVAARSSLVRFDGLAFAPLAEPLVAALHERLGSFWNIGFDRGGRLWVQGSRGIARLDDATAAGIAGWRVHEVAAGTINSLAFTSDGRPVVVGPETVHVFDGTGLAPLRVGAAEPVTWRYGGVDPTTDTLWLWGGDGTSRTMFRGPLPKGNATDVTVATADPEIATQAISLAFGPDGPVALLRTAAAIHRGGAWERIAPPLPDPEHRTSGKIAAAADGTLWISSHNGILAARAGRLDSPTARLPAFSSFTRGLVADGAGGVWAACNGGLVAIRPTLVQAERIGDCRAVLERVDGSLLVGTPGMVWQLPTTDPAAVSEFARLPEAAIPTALVEDGRGRIWVGTRDSFLWRIEGDEVTQVTTPDAFDRELRVIPTLAVDDAGRVWAASANGLAVQDEALGDTFRFVAGYSGRDAPFVIGLAPQPGGGMLVASAAVGVAHVMADGTARSILPAVELPGRRGVVLLRDSRGTLWVGGERGLVRMPNGGPARVITVATGLAADGVTQLTEGADGRLWLTGRTGFLQGLRLDDLEALAAGRLGVVRGIVLDSLAGLGDDECIGRLARVSREPAPSVVVPQANGVIRCDPAALAPHLQAARPPLIRREEGLTLAFSVAASGLVWGEPPLFQTMLAGVDHDWSPPSTEPRREYPAVPPGSYEFRARIVAGETDRDFPVARLSVALPIPWWRSPAAVAGLAAATATIAWAISRGLARRRIADLERQRELDRERARIARDIHDSLGAGLTRVALLSDLARRSDRPADVRDRLDAIHRDARDLTRSVDEIVWAVNPGNDTAARFVSYVVHDVEQFARAGDLSLRLDVPDRLEDLPLPAGVRHHVCLAVRELLQNVLRHAQATHLDFSIAFDERSLTIAVADDGVGFSGGGDQAIGQDGLANLGSRVAEVGGEVTIEASARAGTQVTIRVPLEPQRPSLSGRAIHAT